MKEVTLEMVVAAARRIHKRRNGFPITAKDIWYEVSGRTKYEKFKLEDARSISNILHRTGAKEYITKVAGSHNPVQYTVKEEKHQ